LLSRSLVTQSKVADGTVHRALGIAKRSTLSVDNADSTL
jgi:hypothetical protein